MRILLGVSCNSIFLCVFVVFKLYLLLLLAGTVIFFMFIAFKWDSVIVIPNYRLCL